MATGIAWSPRRAALLASVDEPHDAAHLSPAAWDALRPDDDARLLELLVRTGWYRTIAHLANGVRPDAEPWAVPFPGQDRPPGARRPAAGRCAVAPRAGARAGPSHGGRVHDGPVRDQDDFLTIGRFARLCRLSVKQLRHYDDTGLLRPARVDPATGYRYYAPGQARDALTVALLRDLDVPLAVVAATLAADEPERARLLRAERDRIAERIVRDRARLELLEHLATDGGPPEYRIALGQEPERRLVVARAVAGPGELAERTGACVGRLLAGLRDTPWQPPLWGLFPLDLAEGMRIAVGAEADGTDRTDRTDRTDGTAPEGGPDGLDRELLPGGPVVETVHHGPYSRLPLAYHALLAAVHERGLRPLAPVREAYLVGPGEAPAEEWTTRLVVRVAEERTEEAA
ncbi:MerR family transcriptional regulator [Kitasatospora sp. NPDC002543]